MDVTEAGKALAPFAGHFAVASFGVGLVNTSLMSAAILPLATTYNICEGLGFESGIDKRSDGRRYSTASAPCSFSSGLDLCLFRTLHCCG